ncbi:MAG: excinuclease ABC subunit UvrA [Chloroflexi bacterium]|nr:excinuclease ABC subunit UvrA [Chloroflexota bacterium]
MDPLSNDPLTYYAAHGVMTAPSEMAYLFNGLPEDIPAVCSIVQGLLIHPSTTHLYEVELTSTQKREVNIRPVAEMLSRIHSLDPRPLTEARDPKDRLTGNCRDHAVLFCAILRHQGRPARVRAGFAAYLGPNMNYDHWVVEYWNKDKGRWVMVDPQLDALQQKDLKIDFDVTDMPAGKFFTGAETWQQCRAGKAKSGTFGANRKKRGWQYMRMRLLQDLAAMNKIELLPWDNWWDLGTRDEQAVTASDRKLLDEVAEVILQSDERFSDLRTIYDDPQLSGPVQSRLKLLGLMKEPEMPGNDESQDRPTKPTLTLLPSDLNRLASLGKNSSPAAANANGAATANGAADANSAAPAQPNNGGANGFGDPSMIVVRGAQQHNLRHINVNIPRNKLVVMTGVSGSGKSSLAFDTLYAEGQRRYVESLSAYVRRYLDQMDKPKVDYIGGLSPAISIEQKSVSKNPRSTVGTITEVTDYLRVLYSRAGTQHCPQCGRAIEPVSPQMIADRLVSLPPGTRFQILAPVEYRRKGDHHAILAQANKDGFTRARIDGQLYDLQEPKKLPKLLKSQPHTIELVVDRLIVPHPDEPGAGAAAWKDFSARVIDSVETALRTAQGQIVLVFGADLETGEELRLSEQNQCPHCGITMPELSAQLFSFNAPTGMCPDCNGLGTKLEVDVNLIIERPDLSILDGALRWYGNLRKKKNSWTLKHLIAIAEHYGVDLEVPWKDLPQSFRDVLLWGSNGEKVRFTFENEEGTFKGETEEAIRGIVFNINRLFRQTQSEYTRKWYMSFMSQQPCPSCGGTRLCAEARHVNVGGCTFPEVLNMTIEEAYEWVVSLSGNGEMNGSAPTKLDKDQLEVVGEVLKELRSRLRFMLDVGLHYLNLSRPAPSLSGGEGQRIRLASQLGCGLVGVLYILDEPSIGLHARDQRNLLNTLLKLRDMGNTVLVVEHDEETMLEADWLIDLGPGAGVLGGEVVAVGTPQEVMANPNSLTGQYLSGKKRVTAPNLVRRQPRGWLTIRGARLFNLKNVTARFPLGTVTCITGVSGSGKSSLISETLYPALARALMNAQTTPGPYDRLEGIEQLDKVINITQEPIGRTPRSNPATYVGVFDEIRQVFAATPEARMRGYGPDRFSFNVKGGRCEACQGHGQKRVEMHFLPDVWITCQECKGARYNRHTLEVTYKGKNIADALAMDVQEALEFFSAFPKITRILQTLHDVGLDYVKLGQSATTLSGGEAQRVKLAKELSRVSTGDTIYILDEPTTGLHFADIQRLLDVLHRLADAGNTVVVIEHNMDVIKTADWIIDLGPEGGANGGRVIAEGTPEEVAQVESSYTGQFLAQVLVS